MSDEPFKKPGTGPENPTLDRLKAELSAGLKTGEDPLYYDWTRVAEAPPSEAAYVPPMQIQTRSMDTGDLAAVIGREAAEAARHAPSPGHAVMTDDGGGHVDRHVDVDTYDDAVPTEEMSGGPATDEDFGLARRGSSAGWRRTSPLTGLIVAGAALVLCAVYFLTKAGIDSSSTSVTEGATTAGLAGSAEPAIDPMTLPAAASTSPSRTAMPAAPQSERAVPGRAPLSPATTRSRAAPPPRAVPPKPTGNEVVDPLFTENPGY